MFRSKNLKKPPLPAKIMPDLQHWSEDEVSIKKRQTLKSQPIGTVKASNQTPGAKRKRIKAKKIHNLNNRYEGIQTPTDKNVSRSLGQVARKTIRVATKVKDLKTF